MGVWYVFLLENYIDWLLNIYFNNLDVELMFVNNYRWILVFLEILDYDLIIIYKIISWCYFILDFKIVSFILLKVIVNKVRSF